MPFFFTFYRGDTEINKKYTMNAFNRKVGNFITTEAFIRNYDIAAYFALVESCIIIISIVHLIFRHKNSEAFFLYVLPR